MPNAPVAAAATGLPVSTGSRRAFLNTAAVAVAASLPGCMVAPAAASIAKAAPYLPATSPDADLLRLCAAFHDYNAQDAVLFARFKTMPEGAEQRELGAEIDARYDGYTALGDAVYSIPPKTTAGAAALLGVVLARDHEHEEPIREPLRLLRDALAAMVQS